MKETRTKLHIYLQKIKIKLQANSNIIKMVSLYELNWKMKAIVFEC